MPPKAKTPSKGSAEENPQLNQVLAMLQSMTVQINGLISRIGTMEKKTEAAEVAAIGGVDPKGQRSERFLKGRTRGSERSLKREEQATSRREAYDEAMASLGTTAATRISASIKTIIHIVGVAKSSSKKNEQTEYVETIQMAFETTLMGEIVSRDDHIWEVYADNIDNRETAFVQERVMLTVLQNTLKPGTPATTKNRLAKRKDVLNVRAMYVAVRDANRLSTSKLTTRMLRRKIRECSFGKGANYDEFVDTIEELFERGSKTLRTKQLAKAWRSKKARRLTTSWTNSSSRIRHGKTFWTQP